MATPSIPSLSAFPLLTPEEFDHACHLFHDKTREFPLDHSGWSSVRLVDKNGLILRVLRNIDNISIHRDENDPGQANSQETELEALEDDPEALTRTSSTRAGLQVEYDILLSPSYQVPVLYFTLRRDDRKTPLDIDTVYQHLVPVQYKKELTRVGIMGAISFDYHPRSGAPAFFVHPCNTADAMKHIARGQNTTPERYLLIWLGLVGNCVGLRVPYEAFASEIMQDPKVPPA